MKAITKDSIIKEKKNIPPHNTGKQDFTFLLKSIYFNENYSPSNSTRATTNFANLAR